MGAYHIILIPQQSTLAKKKEQLFLSRSCYSEALRINSLTHGPTHPNSIKCEDILDMLANQNMDELGLVLRPSIRNDASNSRGVCWRYAKGECNRGSACRFEHINGNIQDMKSGNNNGKINDICYAWKRNNCNRGDRCGFRHSEDKSDGKY